MGSPGLVSTVMTPKWNPAGSAPSVPAAVKSRASKGEKTALYSAVQLYGDAVRTGAGPGPGAPQGAGHLCLGDGQVSQLTRGLLRESGVASQGLEYLLTGSRGGGGHGRHASPVLSCKPGDVGGRGGEAARGGAEGRYRPGRLGDLEQGSDQRAGALADVEPLLPLGHPAVCRRCRSRLCAGLASHHQASQRSRLPALCPSVDVSYDGVGGVQRGVVRCARCSVELESTGGKLLLEGRPPHQECSRLRWS